MKPLEHQALIDAVGIVIREEREVRDEKIAAIATRLDQQILEERAADMGNGEALQEIKTALTERIAALERRPAPQRGEDGLGFDDMAVEHDGERTVILRFARGDLVKEFPVQFPVPIYRDVYRPEKAYVRGDVVTFGGSMWHCNAATEEKPGDGSTAWTLAAKRGRDGRDGAVKEGKAKANGAAHA